MSTIEKDGKENDTRRMSGVSRDGKPSVAASVKTPSKSTRYSLGSASKYYFKYVNSSAKKKPKGDSSFSQESDPNFYLNYMNSGKKKAKGVFNEEDTGNLSLLSIPEMAGNNNNSSLDTSVLSLGASSTSSEEGDLLNKSTLSDTTELTASNFVLAATSRQKMREIQLDTSVWTSKKTEKPVNEQSKPAPEQPPSIRNPLGSRQSIENTSTIRATLSQDSTGTAAAATPSNRRLSLRGASPSLRSRISASPKSLRKFTEDLKNSRIQRQMQREEDAKKNAAANSALLNSSVTSTMNSSLLLDGSELSVSKKRRSRASMAPRVDHIDKKDASMMSNGSDDSTDDILGAMDEIFGMVDDDDNTETVSHQPKRSSVTATSGAVDEATSKEQEDTARRDSIQVAVGFQRSRRSSGVLERPLLLDEKDVALSQTKSPKTSSEKSSNDNATKATPSKLASTPQRMANPRLLDSPARNTRSAKKRLSHASSHNDDTASLGDLGDILGGGISDSMSVKSSTDEESVIHSSPMEDDVLSRRVVGSEEKLHQSKDSESDANDETAPLDVVGDLLSQLTQESAGCTEAEKMTEDGDGRDMKSPGASLSHQDTSARAKEGATLSKLARTQQRMDKPRALDSPARNTRSASKRQSYSTAGGADSIADHLGALDSDDDKTPRSENTTEHQNAKSPAISSLLTQRSIGSEEKVNTSAGGDASDTASIGDLGSIFGGLMQESLTADKQDDGDLKSPTASLSHKDVGSMQSETKQGTSATKLAPTPQRMENPRLLDSPARNTRSANRRQSYSSSGDTRSITDLGDILEADDKSPTLNSSTEHQNSKSPIISNLMTQRSIGSEEKSAISDGGDATETASIADLGSIFGGLAQESTGDIQDEVHAKSPAASVSEMDATSIQSKSKEGVMVAKLALTPQRLENPRLLDSPARNTRSAKKRQSYSSSRDTESFVDIGYVLGNVEEKPSAADSSKDNIEQQSPGMGNLMTQRSIGSEEKTDMSEGDVTETASIGDLGSIFGGFTQATTDTNSPMAPRQTYLSNEDSPAKADLPSDNAETEGISKQDVGRDGRVEGMSILDHSVGAARSPKLAPTPHRMEKSRLLDSPARNTRSSKKRQNSSNDEERGNQKSLGDEFGSSAEAVDRESKIKIQEIQSPSHDNLLSQRSFGSEEKAEEMVDYTETASIGDIGDILGVFRHKSPAEASTSQRHPADSSLLNSPPAKTTPALGKVENPLLLDSPARNTRSAKKNQSPGKGEHTNNHTASIADISGIFGDSVKGSTSQDTSLNNGQSSPPSESKNLSQRSFGSAEKEDLEDDADDTATASLGDIRDILGGVSFMPKSGLDSPQHAQNDSMEATEESSKKHRSPPESNFFSQRSFGSEEKSTKSVGENDGDITETASIGDIGNIFRGLTERSVDHRSPVSVHQTSPTKIDSPRSANRTTDSEETELEDSFYGSSKDKTSTAADQASPPGSPSRSPAEGRNVSNFRKRATPTKLPPTPQRIPNPRLLDSPARNTRSANKQKDHSNADHTASIADLNSILHTGAARDDTADQMPLESPSKGGNRSRPAFGSEEKSTTISAHPEEETKTASIEDIGDILGGSTANPSPSNVVGSVKNSNDERISVSNESIEHSSSLSSSAPREPDSSPGQGNLSHFQGGNSATVVFENPRQLDSPARNTRSTKRKNREHDDTDSSTMTNSRVSMSSSIPSSESDDENGSSLQPNPSAQQSFGSDLSMSRDDENDTRTTASMEEINSILFELAQQAPGEGSPIGELNPIVQNYDESQSSSTSQDGSGALNTSHLSKEPQEELVNDSNMSMSLAAEDTSHSGVITSIQRSNGGTPSKSSSTPERKTYGASPHRSRDIGYGSHSKTASAHKSPMRLMPNSHVKPTPTKIKPSPRRVLNPMSIFSPARMTRSAKKAAEEQNVNHEQHHREESKRKLPSYDSEDLRSPMPKKFKPVGILSSMKRRQKADTGASKRTISFGSPEAALYHVGSPSGSFTPLPRTRAKALFQIPSNNASASSSDESREETVGIESNMHILVDKITADNMKGSPELSPIANDQDTSRIHGFSMSGEKSMDETEDGIGGNEHTAELEVNMEELLANAGEGSKEENEHTVQLEMGMEQLVANAMQSRSQPAKADKPLLNASQASMGSQDSSPANSSVDMTDNRSIASMNARSEKYTSEFKMTAMEAQKLDFSMQTSPNGSDDSMEVDEDNTVPLEVDMTSLLAAAGDPSKKQELTDIKEDATTDESVSSPRSPVASTRFSMSREDSPETTQAVEDLLTQDREDGGTAAENMSESRIWSPKGASQEFTNEPYTLTLEELSAIGELKSSSDPESSENTNQDSVVKFNEIVEKMDSFALSRWNQFLQAVCDEVEKQDQNLDGKVESAYDDILDEQPPNMRRLEAILRSQEGSDVETNIRALVRANKDSVEAEWNEWLKNLLDAFSSEWLQALSSDLEKESSKLDAILEVGTQASEKIAANQDRKVRRARRKSLSRRQVSRPYYYRTVFFARSSQFHFQTLARSLEDEIRELEAQIAEEKTQLDGVKEKESVMDEKIVELKEVRELSSEAEALRTDAVPSQKAYMSLRGLHSWNPSAMNESNLAFESVGQYAQTSSTISYNLESSPIEITVSHNDSSTMTMQYSSKSTSTLIDFLSTCVKEHANTLRENGVSSTTEISSSMQSYMWNMGRVDQAVTELQSLKKRYSATFYKKGDTFVFSVEFKNATTTLVAEFDIDHLYPALPLEVQLNLVTGDLDLDRVRRSLKKSAKPGFGNLSRACALLSAFVA